MELEFRLALWTTAYFKCIIKSEVVIFLLFKKNEMYVDQKYLWRSGTSLEPPKSILEEDDFSIRVLT